MAAPVQLHFYESHAPAYELHLFGHILVGAVVDDPPAGFLALSTKYVTLPRQFTVQVIGLQISLDQQHGR